MKRSLFMFIGVLGLMFGLILPGSSAWAGPPTGGITTAATTVKHFNPCVYEDGPGPCVWDSKVRSNGMGISFVLNATQAQGNLSDAPCTLAQINSGVGPCRVTTDQSGGYNALWLRANGVAVATP